MRRNKTGAAYILELRRTLPPDAVLAIEKAAEVVAKNRKASRVALNHLKQAHSLYIQETTTH